MYPSINNSTTASDAQLGAANRPFINAREGASDFQFAQNVHVRPHLIAPPNLMPSCNNFQVAQQSLVQSLDA